VDAPRTKSELKTGLAEIQADIAAGGGAAIVET